jgi:hypothetical protein
MISIAMVFRSRTTSHAVALRDDVPIEDGDVLLSEDGVTFHEATSTDFAGTTEDNKFTAKFTIKNPVDGAEYEARREGAVLTVHGETFDLVPGAAVSRVVPLPDVRVPEYLFDLGAGKLLYVSSAKYKSDYKDFKLFVGAGGVLREVPVTRVERFRDGGTTVITTPAGVLFSPAPRRTDRAATWADRPIAEMDPTRFEIREQGDTVYIRSRGVA